MRKPILLFFAVFFIVINQSNGKFISIKVGIDGLTCSMCSYSVENAIMKLPFVQKVEMDLNTNTALVYINNEYKVDIYALAKKVTDSGFSVRDIKALFDFSSVGEVKESFFIYQNDRYDIVYTALANPSGVIEFQFVDKKLLSKKSFYNWIQIIRNSDKKLPKPDPDTLVYHITI